MSTASGFDPRDEYVHEPTGHPQFSESIYCNFVDAKSGRAGLIRMGNRVNEGHAEVTVLLFSPDGGAAIHFERAPLEANTAFDAGGLTIEVTEPFRLMRVRFSGTARTMADGTELDDPRAVFTSGPVVSLVLDLEYENLGPVYGLGSTEDGDTGFVGAADSIGTGHYQGPCRVTGTVDLGGERLEISALGFRDHSWGPRVWQAPQYWRWISGLVDDRNGFVAWISKVGDERLPDRGMVLRDGELSYVERAELSSEYGPRPHYPGRISLTLHTSSGRVEVVGEPAGLVPLRHRRDGEVARLAELVYRYDVDGRPAYGISEFLDRMVDGVPAGRGEV